MPEATPFSTNGVYNGFPSCFEKVDVSEFEYWTTFSGFNKDSAGSPTQSQIDQSIQLAGKLFWNLYRVTCDIGFVNNEFFDTITEVIINGGDATGFDPEPDPIQPNERVCEGVLTRGGNTSPYLADVNLSQGGSSTTAGFARMYDGDTANEANFVGIGSGKIDWAGGVSRGYDLAPIAMWIIDLFIDPMSFLGGYSNDEVASGNTYEYTYVELEGIHFLWLGSIRDDSQLGPGFTTHIDSATLRAWLEDDGVVTDQAQITGLEFYTY